MHTTPPTSLGRRVAISVAAAVLLLVACGDSGGTPTTAPATTTTFPAGTVATTVAGTGTTAPGATEATTTTTASTTATTTTAGGTTSSTGAPVTTDTSGTTGTTLDPLAAALAVRASPLTVVAADGTEVTFSEWFFATFNREATVRVVRAGNVLAEGTVTDPAVMEDRGAEGFAFFGPDGSQVASITQEELLDAANQALVDAGLDPAS